MKTVFLILAFISNVAMAQTIERFDASKNVLRTSTITWIDVDDVDKACNAERVRRGKPAYKLPSMACSFWDQTTCLIITGSKTDPDSVAHEVLHCFRGNWH
jgi:hypothetical protein